MVPGIELALKEGREAGMHPLGLGHSAHSMECHSIISQGLMP